MGAARAALLAVALALSTLGLVPGAAAAATSIDLSSWAEASYPVVSGTTAGIWTVAPDGLSVHQSANGQPTLFYSDFDVLGTRIEGQVTVDAAAGDDDFVGFVLGFQPGDEASATADYLIIDWKQATQGFDFGTPSCGPATVANVGLAVSRVRGVPTADEMWGHVDQDAACSPLGQGLEELARGATLGNTGWVKGTTYSFVIELTDSSLKVWVDDVLEIDIVGAFSDGRVAFYNFSQEGVTYAGFVLTSIMEEVCSENAEICKAVEYADADGDRIVEIGERVEFGLTLTATNPTDGDWTQVVVTDRFGAEIEILTDPLPDGVSWSTKGSSEKVFLTWSIGALASGASASIQLDTATDLDPGGQQTYTACGWHEYNSGAVLKARGDRNKQVAFGTPSVMVPVYTEDQQGDCDGDGLSDADELAGGTDPFVADTDGDGLSDGDELNVHGTDPLDPDTDGDTLSDGDEVNVHGTDPLSADTDGDGLSDPDEIGTHITDPTNADTDTDGLSDGDEVNVHGTDPLDADTDLDGFSDGDEVNVHFTDPTDAASHP